MGKDSQQAGHNDAVENNQSEDNIKISSELKDGGAATDKGKPAEFGDSDGSDRAIKPDELSQVLSSLPNDPSSMPGVPIRDDYEWLDAYYEILDRIDGSIIEEYLYTLSDHLPGLKAHSDSTRDSEGKQNNGSYVLTLEQFADLVAQQRGDNAEYNKDSITENSGTTKLPELGVLLRITDGIRAKPDLFRLNPELIRAVCRLLDENLIQSTIEERAKNSEKSNQPIHMMRYLGSAVLSELDPDPFKARIYALFSEYGKITVPNIKIRQLGEPDYQDSDWMVDFPLDGVLLNPENAVGDLYNYVIFIEIKGRHLKLENRDQFENAMCQECINITGTALYEEFESYSEQISTAELQALKTDTPDNPGPGLSDYQGFFFKFVEKEDQILVASLYQVTESELPGE